MPYDLNVHHRRSIRLRGYDYSRPGAYYVTICTGRKLHRFGEIVEGRMILNAVGQMVDHAWKSLARRFPVLELVEHIVMPNHMHALFRIVGAPLVGARERAGPRPAPTVGDIVGAFKSVTADQYARGVHDLDWAQYDGRSWQRNFYEHIVRNGEGLDRIREYIRTNPLRWATDPENV
jgi:REP element-mobilizing transposase RayT